MKLQKIQKIKKYKSFLDYSWSSFLNSEKFSDEVNLIFGENGSGKSSICNILKDLSQNKPFYKYSPPEEAGLLIDNKKHVFLNGAWNKDIRKEDILFFDREFVDDNIHLGHVRGKQQGQQEQSSGKMVIEFDSEAIRLRSIRDRLKGEKETQEREIERYKLENRKILEFALSGDELALYQKLKSKSLADVNKLRDSLKKKWNDISKELEIDRQSQQRVSDIQNDIEELGYVESDISLSNWKEYQSIFNFDLHEQARVVAKKEVFEKVTANKEFFESGFEIRGRYPGECPFCQSKSEENGIASVLKVYEQIYDDTYRVQSAVFEGKKEEMIRELQSIKEAINGIDLSDVFIKLKKLDQNYKIKSIYSVEEEENFKKPTTKGINALIVKISNLKKPSKEGIKKAYELVSSESKGAESFIVSLNKLIRNKNTIIGKFKDDNTDEKIQIRINNNESLLNEVNQKLTFILEGNIKKQKELELKEKKLSKLEQKLSVIKEKYKDAKDVYEVYCSEKAFLKLLNKIEEYFKNFNFNFTLAIDTERRGGTTREFPFAFKILDPEGKERDFVEGLSEGELQVLSLCFFFAFLDIQQNKAEKVLVFDDPITSLDDSNLNNLVDLVAGKRKEFSQTFIFTHHKTFLKFLRKKFTNQCNEYNILRNKNRLGGSFLCKGKEERFIGKLTNFEQHILQVAQNPDGFDVELKVVEYGQFLRYETERFIKCRLLHLNETEFARIIDGIKDNGKISDQELEQIKDVYRFCNWTTSHVDVGDDHGLSQLKQKISEFITISKKY